MPEETASTPGTGGYEMVVERGKIREFARATMTHNPEYLDDPVAGVAPDLSRHRRASGRRGRRPLRAVRPRVGPPMPTPRPAPAA